MTPTEQAAERWLREVENCQSVIFRRNNSPDFVTDKGTYEVKPATTRKIVFPAEQLAKLQASHAKVLIFKEGADKPEAVVNASDIDGRTYLYLGDMDATTIRIRASTRKKLEDLGGKSETYDDVIVRLLGK